MLHVAAEVMAGVRITHTRQQRVGVLVIGIFSFAALRSAVAEPARPV